MPSHTHTCPEVSTWGVESSVQASLGHCLMTGNSHNSWPLILLIVFFQKIFHMVPHVVTSQSPQIYRIWFSYLTELCTFWFSINTTAHVNYIFLSWSAGFPTGKSLATKLTMLPGSHKYVMETPKFCGCKHFHMSPKQNRLCFTSWACESLGQHMGPPKYLSMAALAAMPKS